MPKTPGDDPLSFIGYVQEVPGSREYFLIRQLEGGETLVPSGRRYWAHVRHDNGSTERLVRPLRRGGAGAASFGLISNPNRDRTLPSPAARLNCSAALRRES